LHCAVGTRGLSEGRGQRLQYEPNHEQGRRYDGVPSRFTPIRLDERVCAEARRAHLVNEPIREHESRRKEKSAHDVAGESRRRYAGPADARAA
jgi:hypothetical protein